MKTLLFLGLLAVSSISFAGQNGLGEGESDCSSARESKVIDSGSSAAVEDASGATVTTDV